MTDPVADDVIAKIERLIRRDAAGRGLLAGGSTADLGLGELRLAARSLVDRPGSAIIVTGFFIADANPPAAETDGPPGAVLLALALEAIGQPAYIATDVHCAAACRAAMGTLLDPARLLVADTNRPDWPTILLEHSASGPHPIPLRHLIAVERVGPSHDLESFQSQNRGGNAPVDDFRARVSLESLGRCHNMRGTAIDHVTPPLHRLFEQSQSTREVATIGIGDGGNEIGMGRFPWEEIASRLPQSASAAHIPCRIATDFAILAGTSNWGAFGLAAAVLWLSGCGTRVAEWDEAFHRSLLERMVIEGGAVDGVTRRREPTVDGLSFAEYFQTWRDICRLTSS